MCALMQAQRRVASSWLPHNQPPSKFHCRAHKISVTTAPENHGNPRKVSGGFLHFHVTPRACPANRHTFHPAKTRGGGDEEMAVGARTYFWMNLTRLGRKSMAGLLQLSLGPDYDLRLICNGLEIDVPDGAGNENDLKLYLVSKIRNFVLPYLGRRPVIGVLGFAQTAPISPMCALERGVERAGDELEYDNYDVFVPSHISEVQVKDGDTVGGASPGPFWARSS